MATQTKKIDQCDAAIGAWLSERGFNASDFQGAPLTITVSDDAPRGPKRTPARPKQKVASKKVASKKTAGKAKGRAENRRTEFNVVNQ